MAHRIQRIASFVSVFAATVALPACGGGRPDASDGISTMTQAASSSEGEPTSGGAEATGPCEPFTFAECKIYYVDESGQQQCPVDVKLCREDGAGYYGCGEVMMGESGPVRRDGGAL